MMWNVRPKFSRLIWLLIPEIYRFINQYENVSVLCDSKCRFYLSLHKEWIRNVDTMTGIVQCRHPVLFIYDKTQGAHGANHLK